MKKSSSRLSILTNLAYVTASLWIYHQVFLEGIMIFVPLFFFYFLWYASLRFVFRDQDKVLLNTYASRALQVVALGVLAYGYFGFGISLSAQYLTQVCFGFFSCLGGTYIPVTPLTAWYLGLLSGSFFMTIVSLFFQFFEILSRNLERRLSTRSKKPCKPVSSRGESDATLAPWSCTKLQAR